MNRLTIGVATIAGTLLLTACASPDSRTYENGWSVVRNECGEFSSEVRTKRAELRNQRDLSVFSQEKRKIYELKISVTRGGPIITGNKFANDADNQMIESKKIRQKAINNDFNTAVDQFYSQPDKHRQMDQGCLFKGVGIE